MRWELAFMIRVWFLHIAQESSNSNECPDTTDDFPPGSDRPKSIFSLLGIEITDMTKECPLKIALAYYISACRFYPCLSCQSGSCYTSIPCKCRPTDIDADINSWPTNSSMSIQRECLPADERDKKYTCQTNVYQNSSVESLNGCSNGKNAGGFVLVLQLNAKPVNWNNEESDTAVWEIMCNSISVTSNAPSINTTIKSRTTTTIAPSTVTTNATSEDWSATTTTGAISRTPISVNELIIGIVVGVGGGILLTIAIVVIVVLRKRRSESNKFHAKDASQVDAAVPCETPSTNYTIPVPAAYDNAVNGTSLSYQSIVYDNENVNALNDEYSEVRKPEAMSNDAFYDNSEAGRNESHSISDEMAKDYDNANEDPAANSETIVIDNEFYG